MFGAEPVVTAAYQHAFGGNRRVRYGGQSAFYSRVKKRQSVFLGKPVFGIAAVEFICYRGGVQRAGA